MEGVGARLGRSSTRYGPATVFTGPVRKWKKTWVHVTPSNKHSQSNNNGVINVNNGSNLLLYKWTPLTQSQSNSNNNNSDDDDKNSGKKDAPALSEEPPHRKFRYIPIAVLEEQKNEAEEKLEDDKSVDTEPEAAEVPSKGEGNEKPDINDVPMEETPEKNHLVRQDLNESTLDLSLNLNANDDDESHSKN